MFQSPHPVLDFKYHPTSTFRVMNHHRLRGVGSQGPETLQGGFIHHPCCLATPLPLVLPTCAFLPVHPAALFHTTSTLRSPRAQASPCALHPADALTLSRGVKLPRFLSCIFLMNLCPQKSLMTSPLAKCNGFIHFLHVLESGIYYILTVWEFGGGGWGESLVSLGIRLGQYVHKQRD